MVDQVIFQVNTFCNVFELLLVRDLSQHCDARADVLQRSCSPQTIVSAVDSTHQNRTRRVHHVTLICVTITLLAGNGIIPGNCSCSDTPRMRLCVSVCVTVSKNSPMEMSPDAINDIVSTTAMCICTWSPSCYRPIRVNCALCAVTDSDV